MNTHKRDTNAVQSTTQSTDKVASSSKRLRIRANLKAGPDMFS